MQNDILFDNIYIGHSVADAEKLAAETFAPKHAAEKALAEADKPKVEEPKSPSDLKFLDDPILYVREKVDLFLTIAQRDPIEAVRFVPEVAAGIGAIIVSLIAVTLGLLGLGGSSASTQGKKAEKSKKEEDSKATTTGAEKAKGEVTKRNTRSQN